MDFKLLSGVFLEGILSFLSPCVLPLIPLYMSYLSGEDKIVDENGNVKYNSTKVFITTLFFVLGISLTFVLLALSINSIKDYLNNYKEIIMIVGGTLLIIFGLHEFGLININVLNKELKVKLDLKLNKMNFIKAFLLGFVFSLGWSPCIGPLLSNAIILASSESSGYLYILAYGLGLVIPFLITGLFTSGVLNFINSKKNIVKYVSKIAGVLLILYGSYMIYNSAKDIYTLKNSDIEFDLGSYLINYELKDIDGNSVRLKDYKGKYVFLNFTTTWCPYCKSEIPEFEKFAKNEEVTCLFVMSPLNETNGIEDIKKHIEDNDVKLNTIIDEDGILFYYLQISGYPKTYVISPQGQFTTYVSGALNYDGFNQMLEYVKQNNSDN